MKKEKGVSIQPIAPRARSCRDYTAAILVTAAVILMNCRADPHQWEDEVLIDEKVTLPEDKWKVWSRDQPDGLVKVEYRLISGPSIDVLFLNENNANIYEAILKGDRSCEPVGRYGQLSFSPLAGSYTSDWVQLPKGRYYIVAENHDCGTGPPWDGIDNPIEVQVRLLGKKRPASKWPEWLRR